MSEVDRLSNSGLYPALPIADRRTSKDNKDGQQSPDQGPNSPPGKPAGTANTPQPPKSQIDEYA
jgi:hypothetical protein